ncbi:hypothetical protein R1sor_002390 [Riccia sorocarpa]|uniref:non-specific serine/threonine protein kinase n=1 Tax=Riccia sorocarpa TaxID=122646 RepID=A0ABD3GZI7_9MARC
MALITNYSAFTKHQQFRSGSWSVLLFRILLCSSLFYLVTSQNVSEFISIDCGGEGGHDNGTELEWAADTGFLDAAIELGDEGVAVPALVNLNDSTAEFRNNPEQMKTAMAFLPGRALRSKYCYNLPVTHTSLNSTSYLLRAMFPSRNLTANVPNPESIPLNIYGTRFYFTVDSTFVSTIDLDPVEPQTLELVVTSLDRTMHVCLVPLEDRSSLAAISSIELRPLSQTLYPRASVNGQSNTAGNIRVQSTYLILVSRLNFGGVASAPAIRYPFDKYDRLWYAAPLPEGAEFRILAPFIAVIDDEGARADQDNGTPTQVLSTAWEGLNMTSEVSFSFDIARAREICPTPTFYINMMFLDISPQRNSTDQRMVDVRLEQTGPEFFASSRWASFAPVEKNKTWRWFNYKQPYLAQTATYRIKPSTNSTLPALVNAVEVYGEFDAITQRTSLLDALAIRTFSDSLADRVDTAGDPCLPMPWAWLVCSIEIPPRITQINITSKGLTGELKFGETSGALDRLTILDLSNNSFHGSLPTTLVGIVTLRALNVAQNNLSGELPFFVEKSLANLESISLRGNSLNGGLVSLIKALDDPVFSLDLSHNKFTGPIPVEISLLTNLRNLDLSYNSLTGTLDEKVAQLPLLTNLNLRNNSLTGMVPDVIWSSKSKLVNVDLRRNEFTALNLTVWANTVLLNKSFDAVQQKVSLVANKITNIILPSQDLFQQMHGTVGSESDVESSPGFILLGGNPWCSGLAPTNMTLVQRYLCRHHENEDFSKPIIIEERGISRSTVIIIGVTCGVIMLLMAFILFLSLWRMMRRMYELRQIQEELAKDDVRPPFYKYEELKTATKEFSKENELGKGAFGAVYKAVLSDGSVVAVKKLFPTEQNLADFLKEMVLITGIKHRHLVQLKGCCVRDKQRMLVYEYAENNNLAEALWGKDRGFDLSWTQRLNICVGIARGLSYLHEELQPKIIHRDIKPQNILLDKDLKAKIADFGLARPVVEDTTQMATHVGGTLGYFSPEYATLGMFTEKLDVYSYGVLVLEIVSGRRCINLKSPVEDEIYLRSWAYRLCREDKLLDLAAKGLITESNAGEILSVLKTALSCLQEEPTRRPTMSQVVNMLTGNTEVAFDILTELKERNAFASYGFLQDGSFTTTINSQKEGETHSLLNSTSSVSSQTQSETRAFLDSTSSTASGAQPNIELNRMEPR